MANRKISILKFVGTVSLGLLTGASYSLSSFTIPSLLDLPSSASASKAFRSVTTTASLYLNSFATLSGASFFLAYVLSPRGYKHPYLLYTGLFCFGTRVTDYVTPLIFTMPEAADPAAAAERRAALSMARQERQAAAAHKMESSYEVLGGGSSDTHSEGGGVNSEADLEEEINGEEVRREVESYVKKQVVQTAVAGLGFAMAVVGIWGDGFNKSLGPPPSAFAV